MVMMLAVIILNDLTPLRKLDHILHRHIPRMRLHPQVSVLGEQHHLPVQANRLATTVRHELPGRVAAVVQAASEDQLVGGSLRLHLLAAESDRLQDAALGGHCFKVALAFFEPLREVLDGGACARLYVLGVLGGVVCGGVGRLAELV